MTKKEGDFLFYFFEAKRKVMIMFCVIFLVGVKCSSRWVAAMDVLDGLFT